MQIYLLLTEKCNLCCSMCIRGKQSGCEIDFERLEQTDLWREFGKHDIVLTGGEPSLHKEFISIVNSISASARSLTVTTNGTLSSYLKDINDISKVFFQISLDGTDSVHDKIRGKGAFSKTFSTIKKLDEMGASYCVASVVSKKNIDCMPEMAELLCGLNNMEYWRISYEMPFGSAEQYNVAMMTADEWNCFVDKMLNIVRFRLKIQKIFPFELFDKRMNDNCDNRIFNCGSCNGKIYIYPDLTVYPCTCLTDFPLGNLNEQGICEILSGEKARVFSRYSLVEDTPCNKCKYKHLCNGGCIGMSYHFFGGLGYGDARCPLLKDFYNSFADRCGS